MSKHKSVRNKKVDKTKKNNENGNDNSIPILRQLLVLLVSIIFITVLLKEVKGYNWVINNFLKNNLKVIHQYKEASIEERYRAKLGANYLYIKYLVENTPEDAIIIMPPEEVVFPKEGKSNFKKQNPYLISRKTSTSYFTYPRQLVYEDEKDTNELYSKATHVAIINNWGYHKLNYKVKDKTPHTVLPLNNSQIETQSSN